MPREDSSSVAVTQWPEEFERALAHCVGEHNVETEGREH
jgi:hypothetical protein